jgi:hypothetical protein
VDPSFDLTHNSPAREQEILTRYMNFELAYYNRQIYVSTLFFDQVMDLNAPVFHAGDAEKAKAILLRLAGTMKTYNKHLDLVAMEKKLSKG